MQPVRTKLSKQKRRSSVLPSEAMEEKLVNLLNSTTAERARRSIKYMISLFRYKILKSFTIFSGCLAATKMAHSITI